MWNHTDFGTCGKVAPAPAPTFPDELLLLLAESASDSGAHDLNLDSNRLWFGLGVGTTLCPFCSNFKIRKPFAIAFREGVCSFLGFFWCTGGCCPGPGPGVFFPFLVPFSLLKNTAGANWPIYHGSEKLAVQKVNLNNGRRKVCNKNSAWKIHLWQLELAAKAASHAFGTSYLEAVHASHAHAHDVVGQLALTIPWMCPAFRLFLVMHMRR